MFKAIAKYVRAIGYLITGRINKASEALRGNAAVVEATYDRIISERVGRINQFKDAIAQMVAIKETKKQKLESLQKQIERNEQLKKGALAMAKKVIDKHNGDTAAAQADPEYLRFKSAFSDYDSTIKEQHARVAELENDIEVQSKSISKHKVQIQAELRELDKIRSEKPEAVADIISATQQRKLAEMVSGLSEDRTSEELQEMRNLRAKARANATVSAELSGLDNKVAEQELLSAMATSEAASEFDTLMGINAKAASTEAPEPVQEAAIESRLPEA